MRRRSCWYCLIWLCSFQVPQVRHVGGTPGVALGYGYSPRSPHFSVAWTYRFSRTWAGQLEGGYAHNQGKRLRYRAWELQPSIAWSIASYHARLYLEVCLGGVGLYQRIDGRMKKKQGRKVEKQAGKQGVEKQAGKRKLKKRSAPGRLKKLYQGWNAGPWLGVAFTYCLTDQLCLRGGGQITYYGWPHPYGAWAWRAVVALQWDLRAPLVATEIL